MRMRIEILSLQRCTSTRQFLKNKCWFRSYISIRYDGTRVLEVGYSLHGLFFFFFRLFSHQGSPQRIFHLQLFLSSVPSSVTSTSAMSSFTTSINLLYGLPRFLFPGNSIISILLFLESSFEFLDTCLLFLYEYR